MIPAQAVTVRVDGYLVQEKLAAALREIVGAGAWRGAEVRLGGRRHRWDMAFELGGRKVAVEFDGDEHYRHTLKIKTDREKDQIARDAGYEVVRVPYWVQLTTETARYYFGLEATVVQDFPHGFITTKIYPASFCELGVERFRSELDRLPNGVKQDVLNSLRDRAAEVGIEFVMPGSLAMLVTGAQEARRG